MALKKKELIELLYEKTDLQKQECKRLVNSVFEIIKDELASGRDVLFSGFGKWYVLRKEARKGRNPKTGAALNLGARKTVKFKCSNLLRKDIARG
jgi:integration host factor subunit alpha